MYFTSLYSFHNINQTVFSLYRDFYYLYLRIISGLSYVCFMIYSIKNKEGIRLSCSSLGARMVSLYTPNRAGLFEDIIQGYDTEEEYKQKEKSQGAICGRYANRIAGAEFTLNNHTYHLPKNDGNNCLHGGDQELRLANFELIDQTDKKLCFSYFSPHLENGFPGNVHITVSYEFTTANQLEIQFHATTDEDTVLNLTAHPYFNLSGKLEEPIFDHELVVPSIEAIEINEECLPTGKYFSTEHTCFDFTHQRKIGLIPNLNHPQLELTKGYDHCYVFNNWSAKTIQTNAMVYEPISGRTLTVQSDYPGMQLYTSNTLNTIGKHGTQYGPYSAICIEPQYFPDSPNQPLFPFRLTTKESDYMQRIIFTFGTK